MGAPCGHCGELHEAYLTTCPVTGARLAGGTYTLVNGDELLVGNVIGERYHVRDILGQGSTGTVFGTVHAHFERAGAMKVLRPRFTSLDTLRRVFESDARVAFSVFHPSLCEVYDIGSLPDGSPFFVMEKLEGDTLASRLGRERFSTAAAVDLLMQLLAVMEAVHARELLLRDLRPQNIFLAHRRGCRPVLEILDFGLSRLVPLEKVQAQWDSLRAVAADDNHSGALSIPYYLSPERSRSEQGLEPSSDLFVAAVIFYEALTGQRPFNGATWNALLADITEGAAIPVSVLRPTSPTSSPRSSCARCRASLGYGPPLHARCRTSSGRSSRNGSAARRRCAPRLQSRSSRPRPHRASMRGTEGQPHALCRPAAVEPDAAFAEARRRVRRRDPHRPQEIALPERFDEPAESVSAAVDEALRRSPGPDGATAARVSTSTSTSTSSTRGQTSRGDALAELLGLPANQPGLEEETATMHLTPEFRARIEEMARTGAPAAVEDPTRPRPPTEWASRPRRSEARA